MKIIIPIFSLVLTTSAFSQADILNKGQRFNGDHIITAIDSNEVYIWVGTNNGLFRVNKQNNRKKYYSLSNTGFSANYVTDVYCGWDDCVWIGTNHGLIKYDNYGFIPFTTENSNIPENFITSVASGAGDGLLVGTAHNGLVRMHRNRFRPEPEKVKLNPGFQKIALNSEE